MAPPVPQFRHVTEAAVRFLESARHPQDSATMAAHALGAAFARQPAFVRLLEQALEADGRLRRDAEGRWRLVEWETESAALAHQEFVVVDVETTGGRGERHRAVEVAAVLLRDGKIAQQFASLLNPGRRLPRFVIEFTGITQEMVDAAPSGEEVLGAFRDFAGERVLVGHNVACDLTFLNYEALWHGLPAFGNPALDTEELAIRLLPEVRRPSLHRVAAALRLSQPIRHRALADARLAADVFLALLDRLDRSQIRTLADLRDWLSSRLDERLGRVRRLQATLPLGTVRALPDQPGVYSFRDGEGHILYVGKAGSLRTRVAQHFTSVGRASRRGDGLLERTATVDHEVVGCELEALLLESERIRALQPPYNVQEQSRRGCPFLVFEAEVFPRPAAAAQVTAGGGTYFGPYRNTRAVRHTVETLRRVFQLRSCRRTLPAKRAKMRVPCLRLGQGLCPAPCAAAVTPEQYAVLVAYGRLFVSAGKAATLDALDRRLADLALPGPPASSAADDARAWEAQALRECRTRLLRVRREYRPLEGGFAGGNLVMAYPCAGGGATLFFLSDGRLVRQVRITAGQLEDGTLAGVVAGHRAAAPPPEALDTHQANILLRWLYQHSDHPNCIPIPPEMPSEEAAEAIREVALAATVGEDTADFGAAAEGAYAAAAGG